MSLTKAERKIVQGRVADRLRSEKPVGETQRQMFERAKIVATEELTKFYAERKAQRAAHRQAR